MASVGQGQPTRLRLEHGTEQGHEHTSRVVDSEFIVQPREQPLRLGKQAELRLQDVYLLLLADEIVERHFEIAGKIGRAHV